MYYKVLVTSGGVTDVGKTTLSKHIASLFRQAGRQVKFVGVEAEHKPMDGEDVRIGTGEADVESIIDDIIGSGDDLIVDVGGDNFKELSESLKAVGDSPLMYFTHFIVPISPDVKKPNIVATVEDMIARGVPGERINLVFSKVLKDDRKALLREFESVIVDLTTHGVRVIDVPILRNAVMVKKTGAEPIFEIDMTTNYDDMVRECLRQSDYDAAKLNAERAIIGKQAKMAAANYREVIARIFGEI